MDYDWFDENKPDAWYWCSSYGFGTFRLGPTDGSYWDYDTGSHVLKDDTVGYVKVKTRSAQSVTRTSRYRGYVWVSGVSSGYNTNAWFGQPTYLRWVGATVVLQYRMPNWGFWKNATSGRTNAAGAITLKAYAPAGRYWRLVSQEGGTVWGSTSQQVYR